jgi:DNA-binding NarL/FixJ family response regulator
LRILIADDSDVVRRGVARLLATEPNWEVCGEAKDGREALRKAHEVLPDVVLLDINMPDLDGLNVARLLRKDVPQTKILVMSQYDATQMLPFVVAAGGDGCVDKSRLGTDLVASIRRIVTRKLTNRERR